MKTVIPLNTKNNHYLYFTENKILSICHPLLYEMIEIFNKNNYHSFSSKKKLKIL